jgi:hypothetical protein
LQATVDLQRHATRRDFQPFSLSLAIELAILLQQAHTQPDENDRGDERGCCQERGEPARVQPGHSGIILEARVLVTSWLRHETRNIRLGIIWQVLQRPMV